eukprot:SAG11_NODE_4115_length_2059_cov_2.811735_3_plen_84_part_00
MLQCTRRMRLQKIKEDELEQLMNQKFNLESQVRDPHSTPTPHRPHRPSVALDSTAGVFLDPRPPARLPALAAAHAVPGRERVG